MIKIIYAPGCYGTFLARCFYYLTDLSGPEINLNFDFDTMGSSHSFRSDTKKSRKTILYGHVNTLVLEKQDHLVLIAPCYDHLLDYFNNQFWKQEQGQIVSYINGLYSQNNIKNKLAKGWNYFGEWGDHVPRWILREWCSFWLQDCLENTYNTYLQIPATFCVTTQTIFENLPELLEQASLIFNFRIKATVSQIKSIHQDFVLAQKLHNSQIKCNDWVNSIIASSQDPSPCQTIFDEAWVQYVLASKGYEIRCDGLNCFPLDSLSMSKIIYKNV